MLDADAVASCSLHVLAGTLYSEPVHWWHAYAVKCTEPVYWWRALRGSYRCGGVVAGLCGRSVLWCLVGSDALRQRTFAIRLRLTTLV